ncbi:permease prefix domain 1-containing protein [Kocuria sp. M4R2S49]|uniref:permease prefix domain 1-containing protein n=1 Tax=Kocuria rhizosphaericola TaxID=3376284 RepID=UPI003792A77E
MARRLPPRAREDVSQELRGTLADMVDDGVAQGLPPAEAERRALEELGGPALLGNSTRPAGAPGRSRGPGEGLCRRGVPGGAGRRALRGRPAPAGMRGTGSGGASCDHQLTL